MTDDGHYEAIYPAAYCHDCGRKFMSGETMATVTFRRVEGEDTDLTTFALGPPFETHLCTHCLAGGSP